MNSHARLRKTQLCGLFRELAARFPPDAEFLKQAFEHTERLWVQQFNRMGNVQVRVVVGSAKYGLNQT
jgi:hypothetical protein